MKFGYVKFCLVFENKKNFWSEIKNIFVVSQVLSFRLKSKLAKLQWTQSLKCNLDQCQLYNFPLSQDQKFILRETRLKKRLYQLDLLKKKKAILYLNLFQATGLFLYHLKTSENLWFSYVFKGYRKKLMILHRLRTSKNATEKI